MVEEVQQERERERARAREKDRKRQRKRERDLIIILCKTCALIFPHRFFLSHKNTDSDMMSIKQLINMRIL